MFDVLCKSMAISFLGRYLSHSSGLNTLRNFIAYLSVLLIEYFSFEIYMQTISQCILTLFIIFFRLKTQKSLQNMNISRKYEKYEQFTISFISTLSMYELIQEMAAFCSLHEYLTDYVFYMRRNIVL